MSSVPPARTSSRANGYADERERRSRASAHNSSFRSDKADAFKKAPSPQPDSQYSSTSHKRSASGNPRPATRTTEERQYEQRKVVERTFEAHLQRLVPRSTTESEREHRRSTQNERRPSEAPRQKAPETWPRADTRTETPQGTADLGSAVIAKVREADKKTAPWNPEVTLLPHTTAPLASRVSIPPLASTVPQAPQPKPLGELSLEVQEAAIVEDLLFVFMGYEGQYIRYAKGYNPDEERDRLTGPTFRIASGLDPSLYDLTQSMLKLATYYSALEAFVDVQSRDEFGAVSHALCASVRKFLQEYLVMVAQLETQFLTSDTFTVHVLNIQTVPTQQMMMQLYSLAQELLKKNALLDEESDESDDDVDDYENILENLRDGGELVPGNMTGKKLCKGGVAIGLVTRRLEAMSGDPAARALLTTLLRDASRPYMVMLNEWLHHGSIRRYR